MTTPQGPAGVEECENPDCTGCQWCQPPAPAEPKFPHALFTAVFSQDWTAVQHLKALHGWLMRQHAEAEHPEAVDSIQELCTAGMPEAVRTAWLFGYTFRDTPAPGGETGSGDDRSSGS